MMPSAGGGCRFGYYNRLQRMILDEVGCDDVPLFSPNQNDGLYACFDKHVGDEFIRHAWHAIVAVELLFKAACWVRPREIEEGSADAAYRLFLDKTIHAIEHGLNMRAVMRDARSAFEGIPTRNVALPWIGLIGEVYVRMHDWCNQDLVRKIEKLGAHVWLTPLSEWILYVNLLECMDNKSARRWADLLRTQIVNGVMKSDEHLLAAPWRGFLPNLDETPPERTIDLGKRYVDPEFRGETVLGLGKAVDFHGRGVAGLINVMPFTCMPGNIAGGLLKRFQREHDGMPVLTLSFDGQTDANLPIRLEAFVQQCRGYLQQRSAAVPRIKQAAPTPR
jgi:predicted nucleotide-binding protein (sugar kinase/HSP70/actin superfamily)